MTRKIHMRSRNRLQCIHFLLVYFIFLGTMVRSSMSELEITSDDDETSIFNGEDDFSIHDPVWDMVKKSWMHEELPEKMEGPLLKSLIPQRRKRNDKSTPERKAKTGERMKNRKRPGEAIKTRRWNPGWISSGRLELVDGLFQGVTVKITDKIAQEDCRDVMQGLQVVLREMSSTLYVSTEGRAALGRVVVLIPSHWSSRACHPPSFDNDHQLNPTTVPQIIVDAPHTFFHDHPWTQQSRGCGFPGDFIQLGVNFLREANSSLDLSERAGRIMVGEWAKFRWGVFSESGHTGDELYPPWYLNDQDWSPTICSDVKSHQIPCHHEISHRCRWPSKAFENASSSLLSIPSLPQVNLFCSSKTHNLEAPTKHNVLCHGRPTWDVIISSKDFADGRNPPIRSRPPPVQTIFVKPPDLRFVLLVEDTDIMNVQRRWEFVRKAVRRTIVYDLPDEAYISVIVFNSKPREVAPLSKLDSVSDLRERVGSSLPRNPSSVGGSHACLKCALEAALESFKISKVNEKGANIIMITNGGQGREDQLEEAQKIIEVNNFRLLLVLFPFQEYPGLSVPQHSFIALAKKSKGTIYTVMDEGVGNDSKVSMLISLMEALAAAVSTGGADTPVLVHFATYPGGVAPVSSGTFSLDDSLAANAKFSVYYYDLNHVGNTIHLTAPSGSTFASVSMQEEDGDVNMIFVNLHNAERGVWRYKVENRADSHQGLHIQVTSRPNPLNNVKVNIWTNQDFFESETHHPTIIYGKVQINGAPVVGAGVQATLQRLGTNATGGTYPPVKVSLLDLGTGDPDITRGDGIYSRYAPPLEGPARYALMLSVDASQAVIGQSSSASHSRVKPEHDLRHHRHAYIKENMRKGGGTTASFTYGGGSTFSMGFSSPHFLFSSPYYDVAATRSWDSDANFDEVASCCGSVLQYSHTRQSPPFTRQIIGPTVNVWESQAQRKDSAHPSRITDLVAWLNSSTGSIHLDWTAVGDDHDWGQAHHYEGVVTPYIKKAMIQCSGSPLKGLPKPAPATSKETARTYVSIPNKKTVYVCLRAVDKSGNRGPPSNSARVWVPAPPSTDRVTVRARGSGFGGYGSSDIGEKLAVISGCIGGILLIVVLLAAYCYCAPSAYKHRAKFRRRDSSTFREDKSSTAQENLGNGGSIIIRSNSHKDHGDQHGSQPAQGGQFSSSFEARAGRNSPGSPDKPENMLGSQETLRMSSINAPELTSKLPFQQNLEEQRRSTSMSIPDVTKVSINEPDVSHSSEDNQPQFFTLGRRPPQNNIPVYNSLSRSEMRRSAPQRPVSEVLKPLMVNNKNVYNSHQNNFVTQPSSYFTNQHRPVPPPRHRQPSVHESDLSLCGDGSQEGDSLKDMVLSDDRQCSPPPPAPSGPEARTAGEFNFKRHSLGFP